MTERLRIQLIGGLQINFGADRIIIKKKKAAALLLLIAISPDLRISREQLRGLLWPESDEYAAQTSLRNAVWSLKVVLSGFGFEGFHGDRAEVWLSPDQVEVDIDGLLQDLERGNIEPLMRHDPQTLAQLDRDQAVINDAISARLRETAHHYARLIRHGLDAAAKSTRSQSERIAILQFVANMDPADEGAARRLIHSYWQSGQLANALAAYQALWNLLDQDFGEEPSAETQALIVEIKSGDTTATDRQERPRIIVARGHFEHLAPDQVSQAELLRETLCANLARFREWQVFDAALVADETGLPAQSGKCYKLSLQARGTDAGLDCRALLSDQSSGELLWSENLAGAGKALGQNQAGAGERLAVALNLHLSAYRGRDKGVSQTEPSAYERWVEAQGLILQFKLNTWKRAERLLDKLIQDYPNFSRAYSSRASIENMRQISFPGLYSVPAMHVEGLHLARRAIELDPMDSRGQLAMGWSAAMSRQFDRAELAFDLAFQYNENDPWTITSSAVGLAFCDHFGAASRLLDLLFKLNFKLEASHWSYVAATLFLGGDYEGCIKASEKSNEISHDVPAWHAAALALVGRKEEAAVVARRFESIARANWVAKAPIERAEITRWLVSGFPIRNRDVWLKLRDGLRLAGMPVPDLIQSDQIALGYQLNESNSLKR